MSRASVTERNPDITEAIAPLALWNARPGWGISADLIPPELINARQLAVLRRWMVAGLIALLVVCGGGFYLAASANSRASADLAAVQFETTQLQAEGRSYSGVVAIQGSVTQVRTQIAQVMSGDVDLVALMGKLSSNLPKTMTISQEAITISTAGVAGAATTAADSVLDRSGLPQIGTVTLSGTGKTLDDVSNYVDRLEAIPGVVDVMPVSNNASATGSSTQFSITLGLTTALLSHRFDVGTT